MFDVRSDFPLTLSLPLKSRLPPLIGEPDRVGMGECVRAEYWRDFDKTFPVLCEVLAAMPAHVLPPDQCEAVLAAITFNMARTSAAWWESRKDADPNLWLSDVLWEIDNSDIAMEIGDHVESGDGAIAETVRRCETYAASDDDDGDDGKDEEA